MRRLSLLLAISLGACHTPEPSPEAPPVRRGSRTISLEPETLGAAGVHVVEAKRSTFSPSISAGGFIRPDARRTVTVRAPGEGRVLTVAVDVGARVRAGDTVAVLESPEANAALARHRAAAARADVARAALERAQRLVAVDGISRAERDARRAEADAATAEAEAARLELSRLGLDAGQAASLLTVTAPQTGVVLEVAAVEGSLVSKEAPLATVADLSRVWALLDSADSEALRVETGAVVQVRLDASARHSIEGRVAVVEPSTVDTAGRVRTRVVIVNTAGALTPGQFVTAELPLSEGPRSVTAVPSTAIQLLFGVTAVFVETAPGTFELRLVETGDEGSGMVEIRRGLADGERVAADGAFVLKTELLEVSLGSEEDE